MRTTSVAVAVQFRAEDEAGRRQRFAVSSHAPGQARCSVPGDRFLEC